MKLGRTGVRKLRSIARALRKVITKTLRRVVRLGRTGIRLGFSSFAWRILFGYVISVMLNRSDPESIRLSTKMRQAMGNLPSRMLFRLGDFRAAMDQALSDLESRPGDAETHMLVVGCAIELGDFQCAEHHLNLLDASRSPDHLSEQLPFFQYTLTRRNGPDSQELAIQHLDDLYLAMGCRPIRMSRSLQP